MISRRAWIAGVTATLSVGDPRAARAIAGLRPIVIAVLDAPGVGRDALVTAVAAIEGAPRLASRIVTPAVVRGGGLRGADALLVTGGRGSRQGRALGEDGRAAIRQFVREGGGYVGICAGSYLAMQVPEGSVEESYKAAFVGAAHATGDAWQRGIAPIEVVSPEGTRATLHYANGPLFALVDVDGLPTPRVLARFVGEVSSARGGTLPGQMRDVPALIATSYGRGQVVLFSPNPTLDPAVPTLLTRALSRVASGDAVTSLAELT